MSEKISSIFDKKSYVWLITGVAGFIGSNIAEKLLQNNQKVIGIDNFSTGSKENIEDLISQLNSKHEKDLFTFIEGDITRLEVCQELCKGIDFVLHQAALGSIPRSIKNPMNTHNANINGFLNMLVSANENKVKRFIYASSSSVYGDHKDLPKREDVIGRQLNPYAITKYVNELYASNFSEIYGLPTIGLRYFNVFGKRQDPMGQYAAVIPKWISSFIDEQDIYINGDGKTSRDFCYVENAVQINILAALCKKEAALNQVYNVAYNDRTTLNELYEMIFQEISRKVKLTYQHPEYKDFRAGDIRHSEADITKAQDFMGYDPEYSVKDGLAETIDWYIRRSQL